MNDPAAPPVVDVAALREAHEFCCELHLTEACAECAGCGQKWPCTMTRLLDELATLRLEAARAGRLREALKRTWDMLSIIRYRRVVTWGGLGFPTEQLANEVLEQARAALADDGAKGEEG